MGPLNKPPQAAQTLLGGAGHLEPEPFDSARWEEREVLLRHAKQLRVPLEPGASGLWRLSIALAREVDRRKLKKEIKPTGLKRGVKPCTRSGPAAMLLRAEFNGLMASGDFKTEADARRFLLSTKLYKGVNPATLKRRIEAVKHLP